ncbi:MAG: SusD/RagB family nutrient-binding outer membrane lipoprotein, partial [Cyclobacteriaceae bacterium]|nr:SusD/RagB family nutrient-binding outer membrane lipoprotein [Cyclobacteriaceae bacterium HetDA_MAG_MS6]
LMVFGFACDLEETNVNPNEATDAPLNILLPAAQANTLFGIAGTSVQFSSIWIQQMTGTLSDYEDVTNYRFLPGFSEFDWSERLYAGAMVDLKQIIEQSTASEATHIRGVARIMMALCLGHIVDTWGDAPYSTALDPASNPQPTYDAGATLYTEIQTLLDGAITDLGSTSSASPTNYDLVYPSASESSWVAGSAPLWIRTANALKARYYNHLSKVDPAGSAQDALDAIAAGTYTSNADDAKMGFGPEQAGPWFSFLTGTFGQNNIALCQTFIDLLRDRVAVGTDDPRAAFYFRDNGAGLYAGVPYGSINKPGDATGVGDYINTLEGTTNIVTYTEVKFIEAEANFRLDNFPEAAAAYNEAVRSSILRVTGAADPAYEALYANEDAASIQTNGLQKIFTEKHIALFLEHEAWVDWRRSIPAGQPGTTSGIPALTPTTTNETSGVFPRRFLYPQSEVTNNASNVPAAVITDKIFWDL